MRKILILSATAGLLAACSQPEPQKSSQIGTYQIVATSDGAVRINTITGKTEMLVLSDEQVKQDGTFAMQGNRYWSWAEVPLTE